MSWLDDISNIFSSTPAPQVSLYDPNTMLSPRYSLKNLTATTKALTQPNLPSNPEHFNNLIELANFVELIEQEIGPVQIISSYRTKELQDALSSTGEPTSAGTSFHELGRGLDIFPTTMTLDEYFGRMLANETVKSHLAEVAYKPGQNSIHIGINVPSDVRDTKVLALNESNVYGRLSLDEITKFISPYMASLDDAYDYASAQLVTWNKTPLILGMVAAFGGLIYLFTANRFQTRKNPVSSKKKEDVVREIKKLRRIHPSWSVEDAIKHLHTQTTKHSTEWAILDTMYKRIKRQRHNPRITRKPIGKGTLSHLSNAALMKMVSTHATIPGIKMTPKNFGLGTAAIMELQRRGISLKKKDKK